MTDEDIELALKCCGKQHKNCKNCPLSVDDEPEDECINYLQQETLKYIRSLKNAVEDLTYILKAYRGTM